MASTTLWILCAVFLLGVAGWRLLERITWYLGNWQFGYLTFGRDLAHGTVFHRSALLDAIRDLLPERTDVLTQTYIWDHGRVYCRFAPGFPILLALVVRWFGDSAVPYFVATIFMALLVLLAAIGRRLFDSRWLGLAAPALVVLLPTRVHWWGLTTMPDLSAHAAGLLGVCLLIGIDQERWRLRAGAAGLALGWAISTRPDAALYFFPAASVVALRLAQIGATRRRAASVAGAAVLGLAIGLVPWLAYNWAATGNPFRSTQAMEVTEFFGTTPSTSTPSYPRPWIWHGVTQVQVSGGGLRLANLSQVLPDNLAMLRTSYGDLLLGVASLGAITAIVVRPVLFLVTVPYMLVAVTFFSCWSRPNDRLLVGVDLLLTLLLLQGTIGFAEVVCRLARRGYHAVARTLALSAVCLLAVGVFFVTPAPEKPAITFLVMALAPGGLPALTWAVAATAAFALLFSAVGGWNERATDRVVGPVLLVALVVLAGVYTIPEFGKRAPFQQPEVARGGATIDRAIEPGGVVITSEDMGRPAENIEYYAGVPALYLTDLERWGTSVDDVVEHLLNAGMRPYLLLPNEAQTTELVGRLGHRFAVEEATAVRPSRFIDFFVGAPVPLRYTAVTLYRIARRG